MTSPGVTADFTENVGRWRVWATRPGYEPVDVTWVRGVPTEVLGWSWTDPFGPSTASLRFPAVTIYDKIGVGDLFWLAPEVDFDIAWTGPLPAGYPYLQFIWEGFSLPIEYSQTSVSLTLVGAMLQLDNYLAKPEYAVSPMPYEVAIARQWRDKADLRMRELVVVFPPWADNYSPTPNQIGAFTPTGVAPGAKWTGMLTRETGSWDKALSSYVQSMLNSMYTRRGRWTLDLRPGRYPTLQHIDFRYEPDVHTIVVDPRQPGVKVDLSEDWSQTANVLFGQTKALSGDAYSGLQIVGDGQRTVYKPLAALRQVDPVTDRNTWLDPSRMRREQVIQAPEGLQSIDLIRAGQAHLQSMSDPGATGTIVLTSDPRMSGGDVISRKLIRAGMSIQLVMFKGDPDGIMLHITECSVDNSDGSVSLTVDSKYRDRLTVSEVRIRGRDALATPRMLITGRVQPLLPDMLMPWSYGEGSGYIPSGGGGDARRLFEGMPDGLAFPYTEWTTQRPPRSSSWRSGYIKIPAARTPADLNWAYVGRGAGAGGLAGRFGCPIRMSQAGDARLVQIAAYDADGNVMPVGFHFSLYYQREVNVTSMPKIPDAAHTAGTPYAIGDYYPFFDGAFETYSELGVQTGIEVPQAVSTSGFIRGWGTGVLKAGYWPGRSASGDPKTGLLVDEGSWNWNTVGQADAQGVINTYSYNQVSPFAGYLYAMVYCDDQLDQDVYFAGRIFRVEPGSQG